MRIETDDSARQTQARLAGERLGLRMAKSCEGPHADDAMTLAMRDEGWELRDAAMKPGRGVRIDLSRLLHQMKRTGGLSRKAPIARAVGRDSARVIDATAGLGRDAAVLAALGHEVTAIERSGILATMLEAAIVDPAMHELLGGRLRIVCGDARTLLAGGDLPADCIHIDPMFPPRRKRSALPPKEIRLLRALVGDDDDAAQLLEIARTRARRVVVKRPHDARPLAPDVHAVVRSKLLRYDIYIQGSTPSTSAG